MATLEEVLASVTTLLARYSAALSVDGGSKLLTLDRAGTGDTAAVVLQQGGAERWRMGQIGADTFALQRSPTGAAVDYTDVLSVNRSTGAVTITGLVSEGATLSGLSLFTGDVEIANTVASLRLKDTNDANQAYTRIYSYSGVCIVDVDPNNNGESSSSFRVHTDGVERFRVDALGRVGFKTSAPAYDVDVNGSFGVRGATYLYGDAILNTDDFRLYPSTSDGADTARVAILAGGAFSSSRGAYIFACGNEHATDPGNIVISAGNIAGSEVRLSGIGGVKVASDFEVSGAGRFVQAVSGAVAHSNYDNLIVENNSNAGITILTPNNSIGGLVFKDPENATIGDGGMYYEHSLDRLSVGTFSVGYVRLVAGGVEGMRLLGTGQVLIGTTAAGASKLRISGLPTSAAGLAAGDIWNDGGTLKVA